MRANFGPIVQQGYVVGDVVESAMLWAERMGVGPFYVVEQHIEKCSYRGKPGTANFRSALSSWRDFMIELVEPLDSGDNWNSYSLKRNPERVNHHAALVPDIDAVLKDLKLERYVVYTADIPGLRFAYLEEYLPDGTALELMQAKDSTWLEFSNALQAVCRGWDGTRPVRKIEELRADIAALRPATCPALEY